jgi:SAM-dependent methyltransferase
MSEGASYEYEGSELELFAHATRWKAYWKRALAPWIRGDVLEVGAGIGANTPLIRDLASGAWTCLEPDARMLERARSDHERAGLAGRCEHVCGTLATIDGARRFDTIVYLDVLEHIEDDRAELVRAAARLAPGGRVVVLSPAHQGLYTEFDRAIGHFRRYDKRSLAAVEPRDLAREQLFYLDSVGLFASLANRVLLHQKQPSLAQIRTWDRLMVPCSRVLDPLLLRRVGKSIVGVWRR